jgi:hypothetical protein
MVLTDVIAADGRIFLKSEWGAISDEWPAVSFSKRTVGERLRREFDPNRDIILYVGTSNPETTKDPQHRRSILSAIKVEPNAIYDTRELIPPESWARAQLGYRGRWESSMAVRRAWTVAGFPLAPDIIPKSYRSLGVRSNWGNVVEVEQSERTALLALTLLPLDLKLQKAGTQFDDKRAFLNLDALTKTEIGRMVAQIRERVLRSGTDSVRTNPVRFAESDIQIVLGKKWHDQAGGCALCGAALVYAPTNRLLACSADRIDSGRPWYDTANLQITHLACNLAKNDVPMAQFEEWLSIVRKAV